MLKIHHSAPESSLCIVKERQSSHKQQRQKRQSSHKQTTNKQTKLAITFTCEERGDYKQASNHFVQVG